MKVTKHMEHKESFVQHAVAVLLMFLVLPVASGLPLSGAGQNGPVYLSLGQGGKNNPGVFDFGVRLDNTLQDCNGTHWKQTFPDLDYALLGYDILQGNPNSVCDPGFTHPIFRADYNKGRRRTADCRFSVPAGFTVYPCQSCIVSFTSTLVRNKQEMSKHLAASAHVQGGGWGFEFSASASYKKDVAEMSSGESVRVLSGAHCEYYRSNLELVKPPPFDPDFLAWADKLTHPSSTEGDALKFIKYYGTHFFTDVTFGAKFIQSHKISQTALTTLKKESISVEAQASYSGLFSIGGGFSMDTEQRNAASKFMKNVQTTTITVGSAPPSNGDAMTWAASVKSNPVPTMYTLMEIETLFSGYFTSNLSPKVNYDGLRKKLAGAAYKYCQALKMQGKVASCKSSFKLKKTAAKFTPEKKSFKYIRGIDKDTCEELCQDDAECMAVEFRTSTTTVCKFFKHGSLTLSERNNSQIIIFFSNLATKKVHLWVISSFIKGHTFLATHRSSVTDCLNLCRSTAECDGSNWFLFPVKKSVNCHLFSAQDIKELEYSPTYASVFVPKL